MIDASIENALIEMIAKTFNPNQIEEIGRMVLRNFKSHEALGVDRHVTAPKREVAAAIVAGCVDSRREADLLKFLIEIDGNELLGRRVMFDGLEELLNKLARTGIAYDRKRSKIRKIAAELDEMPNFGSLREGREYETTIASIDIVGNSELVRKHGIKTMEKVYYSFWTFLRRQLAIYDGRIWNWAGDGGLVAFAMKDHAARAVLWAMETQRLMPVFNRFPQLPLHGSMMVRIGLDTGSVKFAEDTGQIVSDVINYAAHLEKSRARPGGISVSDRLFSILPDSLKAGFDGDGEFEETATYCLVES
jgi:class 3 adenylate cyclase